MRTIRQWSGTTNPDSFTSCKLNDQFTSLIKILNTTNMVFKNGIKKLISEIDP